MGVEEVAGQMHVGLQIRAFEPEHAQVSRETSMNCDRHHGTKWLVSHHQQSFDASIDHAVQSVDQQKFVLQIFDRCDVTYPQEATGLNASEQK